jgi:parvulin-like peptidyl-prolyl isomerase
MSQLIVRILPASFTLVLLATLFYSQAAPGFSFREFFGLDDKEEQKTGQVVQPAQPAPAPAPEAAKAADRQEAEIVPYQLDFTEVQKIISVVDEDQRKVLLSDSEAFANFIRNEARNKSVLSAAHANKIDQNERNRFIAQRGLENIYRQIYLRQLIASRMPADFPTEEQMKNFYDQNRDRFVLEERVQVWQIFLPIKDAKDVKETELVKKQAEAIISDLNKNTINFSDAAEKYSKPPAGKYNGGYMGLVKISELKPDIKEPLLKLAPEKISAPVKTAEGIHILKRGNIIPRQELGYEEVKNQIRGQLVNQFENQLRQAIFKQASETYPVDINEQLIEEWQLKLRTNFNAESLSKTTEEKLSP